MVEVSATSEYTRTFSTVERAGKTGHEQPNAEIDSIEYFVGRDFAQPLFSALGCS